MATSNASSFQPAFKRVVQSSDFDDAFACIATLTGTTLAEIRQLAIDKFRFPKFGPYAVTDELIKKLLSHFGLISTPYKEITGSLSSLGPDVAILWIPCDPANESIGRTVVFHRARATGEKGVVEYVIDPAYWLTDPAQQVRTDIKALGAAWWIGVHPAKAEGK